MSNLGWLNVSDINFNALLFLEPFQIKYLSQRKPDQAMGNALRAHPVVQWYLKQAYSPIQNYISECLAFAKKRISAEEIRQAEISVLNSMQDWLIYVLDPAIYDQLEFLKWDDSSLLGMADFEGKIILDIGSGTGRLAFTVAPLARVVYAIEPVANLRRYLWEKSDRLGIKNVYPLDGSITQIPLETDFADILMAGHVFGEDLDREYNEMERVVRDSGIILLHPGTNATSKDETHSFLVSKGFNFDTYLEPGEGMKRKYWKTIKK